MEGRKPRTTRTKEERAEAIDEKIAYHTKCIAKLKKKKEDILKPKDKDTYKELIKAIKASGKKPEEIILLLNGSNKE